jgi:hypothetical protein
MDRRTFVKSSLGMALAMRAAAQGLPRIELESLPSWWDVDRSVANRENAYWVPAMQEYAEAQRMSRLLLEKYKILTVARRGIMGAAPCASSRRSTTRTKNSIAW